MLPLKQRLIPAAAWGMPAKCSLLCAAGAAEVRREVSALSGLDLPATLIFDYPSVAAMAGFVVSKLPPAAGAPVSAVAAPVAAGAGRARGQRSLRRQRAHNKAATGVPAAAGLSAEAKMQLVAEKVRLCLLKCFHLMGCAPVLARWACLPTPLDTLQSQCFALQVQQCVAKVLGGAEVAASTPLMTAGLDSLGAVELRKELGRWAGPCRVAATCVRDWGMCLQALHHSNALQLGSGSRLL